MNYEGYAIVRADGNYVEFGHKKAIDIAYGGPDQWLESKRPGLFGDKSSYRVVPATLTIEEQP